MGYHVQVHNTYTELQKTQLTIVGRRDNETAKGNHSDARLLQLLINLYDQILQKLNLLHDQLVLLSQQQINNFAALKNIVVSCQQNIETRWQQMTAIVESAPAEITSIGYFNQLIDKLGQLYRKIKDKTPETANAGI